MTWRDRLQERRTWYLAAFAVSAVATLASLRLSGIGPIGWDGLYLIPCELCWYQRILMYPLPTLLAIGAWRRIDALPWLVIPLSALGAVVAAYHVLLQADPSLETGRCIVGSCSTVQYRAFGLTVPQWSLLAFALVTAATATAAKRPVGAVHHP